jgi:hypothetical protein
MDDEFNIIQKCVKIQMIDDEMTGEKTARELIGVLLNVLQLDENNVVSFIRDRASVNCAAFRQLEVFFPIAEDIGCLSHTVDHIGDKFATPTLKRFWG